MGIIKLCDEREARGRGVRKIALPFRVGTKKGRANSPTSLPLGMMLRANYTVSTKRYENLRAGNIPLCGMHHILMVEVPKVVPLVFFSVYSLGIILLAQIGVVFWCYRI